MGYEKTLIGPPLWLSAETLQAIIEEASGELARNHFRRLNLMGGYAPSPQFREIADYMREQAEAIGLEEVRLEEFPSDGERYYWAFRTEPNLARYTSSTPSTSNLRARTRSRSSSVKDHPPFLSNGFWLCTMHCVVAGYVLGDEYEGAADKEEGLLAVSGGGVDYGGE
ncbi:hypothetical protein KAW53_07980 [Candidatus Bathyarchaeota archaeon]|nr:hypothetical protein [Candidatus Bathyarchaeota archaeon]